MSFIKKVRGTSEALGTSGVEECNTAQDGLSPLHEDSELRGRQAVARITLQLLLHVYSAAS